MTASQIAGLLGESWIEVDRRRIELAEPIRQAGEHSVAVKLHRDLVAPVEGLPAEVHLHCCHSVYKRQSDVIGDYKPILPRLEGATVDRVNLEFAYPGTGDVSDLELLPDHLGVGMGVVDVRTETLPSVGEVEALGAAGAAVIGADRIALNPDCGFAPDMGEPPSIDEAYEKLMDMAEDYELGRIIEDRKAEKADAVEVSLDEL